MSKEKPEGEVVNFHTKIHLDLTEALAKRLGQAPTDEAVEEERKKNKKYMAEYEEAKAYASKNNIKWEWEFEEWSRIQEHLIKLDKANEDWAKDHPDEE